MKKLQAIAVGMGMAFLFSGQSYVCAKPEAKMQATGDANTLDVSSAKNKFGHHALKIRIYIDAPANLVWDAIRENRASDPDVQYSKFTEISDTERLLEQKYNAIPLLGSTTCLLKLEEKLNQSIDYNLVKSDRLSEFEGSWVLTKADDERGTVLELSNHLKLNLPVPQRLIDAFSAPKMKARILFVKNLAENKRQLQIASKN